MIVAKNIFLSILIQIGTTRGNCLHYAVSILSSVYIIQLAQYVTLTNVYTTHIDLSQQLELWFNTKLTFNTTVAVYVLKRYSFSLSITFSKSWSNVITLKCRYLNIKKKIGLEHHFLILSIESLIFFCVYIVGWSEIYFFICMM